ncbi:GNAT family N-acetyltransferase [Granulicoccus phenolivorans]|uniref:GNAT family N-acetyltransferase n=1 Tax=Granulicoccus phenolivorans TaxID=266854 RepID=UPI000423ADF9|nr:GNAT family protein [Granulicoccus phenolivorans]
MPEPRIPAAEPLAGRYVRLEPLTEANIAELGPVLARPETFAGGWAGGPAATRTDPAEFTELLRGYALSQERPWLVRLPDGRPVGTSTLSEFDPVAERLHLGWTAYAREVWGTVVNAETKLLLLGMAFDHGWGRVKLQSDVLNTRSRAAIAGLGATFEGITRRDKRRADGTWRDAAVYSVIIDDWPRVRSGLTQRVSAWDPSRPLWQPR